MSTDLERWKYDGNYFTYAEHKVFYKDSHQDDKPALVCLHGFPASSWDWREVWEDFSLHFRIITFDMLGFGFSDKPRNHTHTITEQAEILQSLMKHLGIQSYHLIAHDFGTLVAQELLTRSEVQANQPKLLSVFAMSGSIFPELSNPRLIQKLLISPMGPVITKLFNEKKFYRSLSAVFGPKTIPTEETLKNYWRLLTHLQGHKQLHTLNFFLKDRKYHGKRWASSWQKTSLPVRYVAGEADPMYGLDGLDKLDKISNQRDIHSIPDIGHFPHIEAPKKVVELFEEFIFQTAT